MGDPFQVFANASDGLQETLKIVWPDLYDVLAKLDQPVADRAVRCAIYKAHPIDTYRRAVGRLIEDGPPACLECIALAARRPGGFPLRRETK